MPKALRLYNTVSRQTEDFKSLQPEAVSLYCCGPTVYNYAHIGNMRTYLFEDLLRRVLEGAGYQTKHVMNITDVGHLSDDGDAGEDKIIKAAREKGMDVWDIARFFTDAFFSDCARLRIKRPHLVCKATDYIASMIAFIKKIEERGFAYQNGGNLYFDTSKDDSYGFLRGASLPEGREPQHSRTGADAHKKQSQDFVLWFTQSKFEHQAMLWESPWGKGYPGWHIECSAMSYEALGPQFDIHCGGVDHIGVHHTNEAAQNCAAYGSPGARCWMHSEFLTLEDNKMSKSSGSFLTVASLEEQGFDALDYRYFCLGGHYRKPLAFSFDALCAAKSARGKLKTRALELQSGAKAQNSAAAKAAAGSFFDRLCNDLNGPEALAEVWALFNKRGEALSNGEKLYVLQQAEQILDLGLFDRLPQEEISAEGKRLLAERAKARAAKDFAKSDLLRDQLAALGIAIKDTPEGMQWEKIK